MGAGRSAGLFTACLSHTLELVCVSQSVIHHDCNRLQQLQLKNLPNWGPGLAFGVLAGRAL